jgi:hypothetical protein
MTEQVSQALASVALTPDDADWMLARLHRRRLASVVRPMRPQWRFAGNLPGSTPKSNG